ncbi:MAG: energy transducer TonB, partial [Burkholderiaceae bacterium]|nr:energy transducer TonB [Burkholderiaceae bacterium]
PPPPAPRPQGGGGSTADSVAAKASTAASFDAAYLNNPAPRYPISAFRERAQGTVIVRAEVLPDGKSGQVVLHRSSGFKSLDDAAIATVKQWRFKPATENGKPIKQWVNIPISFKLNQR